MATRPAFLPRFCSSEDQKVQELDIEFDWHPGFSVSQKQKSIRSLHNNLISSNLCKNPLEISSKSPDPFGVALSAFNLKVRVRLRSPISAPVETVYQGSKLFSNNPRNDLDRYNLLPIEARRRARILESSEVITGWEIGGYCFDLASGTDFYDWLYIGALYQGRDFLSGLAKYDCFTDIEFNPKKSLACQARSAALARSLLENADGIQSYLKRLGESHLRRANQSELPGQVVETQLNMFDNP